MTPSKGLVRWSQVIIAGCLVFIIVLECDLAMHSENHYRLSNETLPTTSS